MFDAMFLVSKCSPSSHWESTTIMLTNISFFHKMSVKKLIFLIFNFQIIVVVLGLAKISFGLVQCYRSQTGIFRPKHHHHREPSRNLFTQASTESTITTSGAPLLLASDESPIPVRGATIVPQVILIL